MSWRTVPCPKPDAIQAAASALADARASLLRVAHALDSPSTRRLYRDTQELLDRCDNLATNLTEWSDD